MGYLQPTLFSFNTEGKWYYLLHDEAETNAAFQ